MLAAQSVCLCNFCGTMDWLKTVDYALYWLSKPPPVDPPEKDSKEIPAECGDLLSPESSEDDDIDGDGDHGYLSALSESLSEMSLSQDVENWLMQTGLYDLISESFDRAIPMDPEGGRGRRIVQREETIPFRDHQNEGVSESTRQGKSSVFLEMKQNTERSPESSIFDGDDPSTRLECGREKSNRETKFSVSSLAEREWEKRSSRDSLSPKSGYLFSPKSFEEGVSGNSFPSPLFQRQDSDVLVSDDSESGSPLSGDMATDNTAKNLEETISNLDKALQNVYRGKYSSRKRKRRTMTPPAEVPPPKVLSHSFSNEDSEEGDEINEISESITPRNRRVTFSPSVEERYAEKHGTRTRTRVPPNSSHSNGLVRPKPASWENPCLISFCSDPAERKVHRVAPTRWLSLRRLLCSLKDPGISPEEEARIRQQVSMVISEKASNNLRSGPKGPEQIEVIHVEESFGESNDFFRYGDPDGIVFVAPDNSIHTKDVPWWRRNEWKSPGDSATYAIENNKIYDHLTKQHHAEKRLATNNCSKDSKHLSGSASRRVETQNLSFLPVSSKDYSEQPEVDCCRSEAPSPSLGMKNITKRVHNERTNASARDDRLAGSTKREIIDLCDCTEASKDSLGKRIAIARAMRPDGTRDGRDHPKSQDLSGSNLMSTPRCEKNPSRTVTICEETDLDAASRPTPELAPKSEDVQATGGLQYAFDSVVENVSNEIDSVTREFTALVEKWDSMVLRGVGSLVGEKPNKTSEVTQPSEKDACLRTNDVVTEDHRCGTLQQAHYPKKDVKAVPVPRPGRIPKPRPEFLLSSLPSPVRHPRILSSSKRVIPSRPHQILSLSDQPQHRPAFHPKDSSRTYNASSLQSKRESLLCRRARIQARLDSRRSYQQNNKPGIYPEVRHAIGTRARIAARRCGLGVRGHAFGGRPPRFSTEHATSKLPPVSTRIQENHFAGCPSPSEIPTYQHTETSHIAHKPEGTGPTIKRRGFGSVDIVADSCSTSSSGVGKCPVPSYSLNHTTSQSLHSGGNGLADSPIVVPPVSSHFMGCVPSSFVESSGTTKLGSLRESVKHAKDKLAKQMTALMVSKERSQQDSESAIFSRSANMADGSGVLLFKPTINVYGDASAGIETINSFTKEMRNGSIRNKAEQRPSNVGGEVTNDRGPKSPGTTESFFDSHELFSKDLGKRFEETDSVLSELLTLPRSPREKRTKEIFDEEDGLEDELEQLAWSEKLLRDELESIQEKEAAIRWKSDAWNFHPSRVTRASRKDAHADIIDLSNIDDEEHKETCEYGMGLSSPGQETIKNHPLASILIPSIDHDHGNNSVSEIGVELVYVEDSFLSTDSLSFGTMKGISFDTFMPMVADGDRSDHQSRREKVDDSQVSRVSSSYRESCSGSSKCPAMESAQTDSETNPTLELPSDESDEKESDPHQGKVVHVPREEFPILPPTTSPTRLGEDLPWGKVELLYREREHLKTSKLPDGSASMFQKEGIEKNQRRNLHSRAEEKAQESRFTSFPGAGSYSADDSPWESSSKEEMDSFASPLPNLYVSVEAITVPCDLKKVSQPKSGRSKPPSNPERTASNWQSGKFTFEHISSWETELTLVEHPKGAKCNGPSKTDEPFSTIERESKAKSESAGSIESVTSRSCLESIASEEAEQRLQGVCIGKKNKEKSVAKSPSTSIEEESITGFQRSPLHPYWSTLKPDGFNQMTAMLKKSSFNTNDFTSGSSISSSSCLDSIPSTEADQNPGDKLSSEVSIKSATESRCPSQEDECSDHSSHICKTPATDSARDLPWESGSKEAEDSTDRGKAAKFSREDSRGRGGSSAKYSRLLEWHSKHRCIRAKLQSEFTPADQAWVQPRRSRRRVTHGIYAKEKLNSLPQSPQAKASKTPNNSAYTPRLLRLVSKTGWKSLKSSLPATARARHLASAVPGSLLWEAATDGDSGCMYS